MVKEILIVGGGTSGWCSAAALAKFCPDINVTVIESSKIPTIGVGESTIQFFNYFIRLLELKDEEWMPYCNATYKGGIKFSNFIKDDYYHAPFRIVDNEHFLMKTHEWSLAKIADKNLKNSQYAGTVWPGAYLLDEHKMPESGYDDKLDFSVLDNTSYNLDAAKFGEWLRDNYCKPRGVKVIDDVIKGIRKNGDGSINTLYGLDDKYNADLFIDCTGFKAMLLEEVGVEFKPYDELWNDRAVVVNNIPYTDKEKELEFVVDTIAKEDGWIWNIPLWNRISNGFVHSSKYLTEEEAKEKLIQHISEIRGEKIAKECEPFTVNFKNGRREVAWKKNVVGIGLSFGFIEPLGSTGLLLTQNGILNLIRVLKMKRNDVNTFDSRIFNKLYTELIDDFKDFYLIHFLLTNREDTEYWKNIKYNNEGTSETFDEVINKFKSIVQGDSDFNLEPIQRWYSQFVGLGYTPLPLNFPVESLAKYNHNIYDTEKEYKEHIKNMPSVYQWLSDNIYRS